MKSRSTQPPPATKAAIYCRVSTHERVLRQYCEAKGYVVYEVYRDTESGTTLDREYLQHFLGAARGG